jgi:hypothetical protein
MTRGPTLMAAGDRVEPLANPTRPNGSRVMRKTFAAILSATALMLVSAAAALGISDNGGCVGQFSSFFAHGGGGTTRSAVAQDFAHNSQPAGANVYSHVAEFHGDLEACFEQT